MHAWRLMAGVMIMAVSATVQAQTTTNNSEEGMMLPGIPGPVKNFTIPASPEGATLDSAPPQGDLDLKRISHWALNYLLHTPRPEENYQPTFSVWPLSCPPAKPGWDTIVDGDTDCRMEWEYYYMRDISGCMDGMNTEKKVHERIKNYVGPHDLCWTYIGCFDMDPSPEVTKAKGLIGNVWATTKLLKSMSLSYDRHHDQADIDLAKRLFTALRGLAVWTDDKKAAYLPGGMGPLNQDLQPAISGWGVHPPPIIEPVLCYWRASGDPEALEFAKAFAEGIMTNARPGNVVKINPDGSFSGHMHATLHAMWGITRLGVETRDPRYIEYTRPIYEFVQKEHSAFTGWIHEACTPAPDSVCNSGEMCATSDMMSMVAWLAQADGFMPGKGLADYYDHLERYFRDYVAVSQFFITPEFEAFYRERHKDKTQEEVEAALVMMRKFEGGFIGGVGINGMLNDYLKDDRTSFSMQGCCVPEGMRAVWTTWSNILRVDMDAAGNKRVFVNMSLPREAPEANVISYLPNTGRVEVDVKEAADFYMRPPAWAPRNTVKAWRGGASAEVKWDGAYVSFGMASPGEKLTITYPLAEYQQTMAIWSDPGKHEINPALTATFTYKGNWTTSATPAAEHFAFYTGKLPALPSEDPKLPE